MKIIDVEQGTPEWLAVRAGIPTASEFSNLLTPKLAPSEGAGFETYVCRKVAERWLGRPLQEFSGGVMEQGSVLEDHAIPWFELEHRCTVRRVGFITTDDGRAGASPDGLLDANLFSGNAGEAGLEFKCPQPTNHVKWLRAGIVPKEHILQCQGGMYVTGLQEWLFVSYCPEFPALVLKVRRNEDAMKAIAEALDRFNTQADAMIEQLTQLNGGPLDRPYTTRYEKGAEVRTMKGVDL